ncbi:sporulation integral membrane protein YtvI [Diplocloster agilis]|uniref:sporulation integral membrane protein YtvI n=1 Tax=Diplocloster agilis TaxID=2850323 RepID=UPI0008222EEF|nr:sporulation integral membrane protein YtvI [Suonthocola fibrivorans]MCU6736234.1 sporulation integral membrane protein YtvI [Suonthocola fibrivorans]SCJ88154.1 pheromone autoinducer 2 transporter [uncultured Clostridium sp.]
MNKATKYLKTILNLLIWIVGLVLLCYFAPRLIVFFMPLVIGWIIAMIANPLVRLLERRLKIVRKHGSMLIIIGTLALVVLAGYLAISKIITELGSFVGNLPEMYESVSIDFAQAGQKLSIFFQKLPQGVQDWWAEVSADFGSYVSGIMQGIGKPTVAAAGNIARNLPSVLISIIFAVLSAYFFIADRERILAFFRRHTPQGIQKKVDMITGDFKHILGGYFKAQFKIMGIVALILFIGFVFLGVNYAVIFAILIAILDFLPFFGTGTALIPWALFKILTSDYRMAIGLMIIYGVSQLVRQLIQPKMVGDSVGLDPLMTLLFMFLGYRIDGVLGMILAVPLGLIILNLYKAGIFDDIIRDVKSLVDDFNSFRKN